VKSNQRRAAGRRQTQAQDVFTAGLRAINVEAAGSLDVLIVDAADAPRLFLEALSGSRVVCALLRVARRLARKVASAKDERPLCLICPAELHAMFGVRIGIAVPHRADPTVGVAFVLCPACAAAGDVDYRVLTGLRGIWPDARRLVVTHPEGGRG